MIYSRFSAGIFALPPKISEFRLWTLSHNYPRERFKYTITPILRSNFHLRNPNELPLLAEVAIYIYKTPLAYRLNFVSICAEDFKHLVNLQNPANSLYKILSSAQ